MAIFYGCLTASLLHSFGGTEAIPDCFLDAYPRDSAIFVGCRLALLCTLLAGATLNLVCAVHPVRRRLPARRGPLATALAGASCMALAACAPRVTQVVGQLGVFFGLPEAALAPALLVLYAPRDRDAAPALIEGLTGEA